eukprot:9170795-Pyramimonas_sp.AAC.1
MSSNARARRQARGGIRHPQRTKELLVDGRQPRVRARQPDADPKRGSCVRFWLDRRLERHLTAPPPVLVRPVPLPLMASLLQLHAAGRRARRRPQGRARGAQQ